MSKRIVVILVEIIACYGIIQAFNRFIVPEFAGFIGINPHPYWLGILIFSISYGTYVGFFTGFIAAGLYILNTRLYLESYLLEDPAYYVLPILFMLVGLILGEISRRFRASIDIVQSEKNQLIQNVEKLEEEVKTLWKIKYELEQKVVTQVSTLTTLYEGARQLDSSSLKKAYKSIVYFFSKVLDVEEASIYEKQDNGWHLKETFGWKEYHKDRAKYMGPSEGIIGLSGSKNKVLSIRDFTYGASDNKQEMPTTLGDAIISGPIRKGENGPVVAVYSVQKIPFLKLNSSTMIIFTFLLNWASRAIEKMDYVRSLKSEAIRDINYNAFTYRYFMTVGDRELQISKKYGVPTVVGLAKIICTKELSSNQFDLLMTLAAEIIKANCRESDVVSICDIDDVHFCFMLISSTESDSFKIRDKIISDFKEGCSKFSETQCKLSIHLIPISTKYNKISELVLEEKKVLST